MFNNLNLPLEKFFYAAEEEAGIVSATLCQCFAAAGLDWLSATVAELRTSFRLTCLDISAVAKTFLYEYKKI